MTKDKKILYTVSLLIAAVLISALFINVKSTKLLTAALLIPLTLLATLSIKKRSSLSIEKREVLLLTAVIAVIYVILLQLTGLHFGFYKNPYFVNGDVFLKQLLPSAVIIIASEWIRYVLLSQKSRFAAGMAFLSCTVAEVLIFSGFVGITSLNRLMDLVGLTLFPAFSANIYYQYVSKSYGALPNIVYRLVTTLYVYLVPTLTSMNDALHSCIKIVFPVFLLAFVSALFTKKKKNARQKGKKLSAIAVILTVIVIASVAMLISCQFRFGALVIATESMTGEINKGDMILYERYDGQPIREGQVIVFLHNNDKIVHRVARIENIGGVTRYYTKGDANNEEDLGYRLEEDIFGLTDFKISYIGYPTLLLRELLQN